jgi:hypothetical protein
VAQVSGPFDEQQLAADLHRAAESYEPDTERIRMLMAERNTARRPGRGGWTVTWVAAAASVVFAVTGAEAVLSRWDRDESSSGPAAAGGTPTPASSSPEGVVGQATSVVRTPDPAQTPSGTSAVPAAPRLTGPVIASPWVPPAGDSSVVTVTPRVAASTVSPGAAPPTAGSTGQGAGSATVRRVLGDRMVSVDVSAVAVGTRRTLGADAGQWMAFAPVDAEIRAVEGPVAGWRVGPTQVMGSGSNSGPGPFVLTWSKSAAGGAGSSSVWLTAPHDSNGAASGLRIPVRYGKDPVSVTLLVGTIGGGGQLNASIQGGSIRVDLPRCSGSAVCPAVVRIDLQSANGGTASSSDLLIDLAATDPGGAVGFAAAEMG